jgi:hypothetical protein
MSSGRWNSESSGTTGAGVFKTYIANINPNDSYVSKEHQL